MSKPQTLDEILEDILLYEPCRDYSWWVTTGIKQGGKKLLGPFVSRELALSVRTYMEIAEAPATEGWRGMSDIKTIDEELRALYQRCDVSNNGIDAIGESEFVNTIKAHTNSEITAVLDRLAGSLSDVRRGNRDALVDAMYVGYANAISKFKSAIEAERKRL